MNVKRNFSNSNTVKAAYHVNQLGELQFKPNSDCLWHIDHRPHQLVVIGQEVIVLEWIQLGCRFVILNRQFYLLAIVKLMLSFKRQNKKIQTSNLYSSDAVSIYLSLSKKLSFGHKDTLRKIWGAFTNCTSYFCCHSLM